MKICEYPRLPNGFLTRSESPVSNAVRKIIRDVRVNGDRAVRDYTLKFDRVRLVGFRVAEQEIERARADCPRELRSGLKSCLRNIKIFALRQFKAYRDFEFQIRPGVFAGQKIVPIERVGIYVPAGRYPLVSTLLMCGVPAQIAGVKEIAVCSPPSACGSVRPEILAAADLLGIREIYRIGGVQAVAALALGTRSVKKVDKIVGPGNEYVAQAKKEVFGTVGIDLIAGPTEVMIIADRYADPRSVAADLLAQAEHDPGAVPIAVTDSRSMARSIERQVRDQLAGLPTRKIARESLNRNGLIILVRDLDQAIKIANQRAPEHLELQIRRPEKIVPDLKNYGSMFIGANAAEALADYSSGLNHTLPTNLSSRYTGGLSVRDFIKIQTTLRVEKKGLRFIGPAAEVLARSEGLEGHFRSIKIRRNFKK
jgi:histidinol dehydrogenase